MLYPKVKRTGDLIVAMLALIFLLPFYPLLALLIKIDSAGPVLFRQERIGLHGRVFTIYKLRSMCLGAEKGGVYEAKDDPRVTRVGKFLRRTSINELPQLVNIIKGEMSLIGPRPVLTYHPWPIEQYTEEQMKRFAVRPGVTGWAQVNGRKNLYWDERIAFDIEYVKNLSLAFDLKIFLKTIVKVLSMQNSYNIGETVRNSNGKA